MNYILYKLLESPYIRFFKNPFAMSEAKKYLAFAKVPDGRTRVHGGNQGGAVRLKSRDGLVGVHPAALPVVQTHDVGHHNKPRFLGSTYTEIKSNKKNILKKCIHTKIMSRNGAAITVLA